MHGPARWSQALVGLPYRAGGRGSDGFDCWGLLERCHERYGVSVGAGGWPDTEWVEVTRRPEAGDVVRFRSLDPHDHVGFMVSRVHFLHILDGLPSRIDRVDGVQWRDRILGYYRHPQMPAHA